MGSSYRPCLPEAAICECIESGLGAVDLSVLPYEVTIHPLCDLRLVAPLPAQGIPIAYRAPSHRARDRTGQRAACVPAHEPTYRCTTGRADDCASQDILGEKVSSAVQRNQLASAGVCVVIRSDAALTCNETARTPLQ